MIKNNILSYFLDKPGTYDEEHHKRLTLNLASKEVCTINDNETSVELRFSKQSLDTLKNRYNVTVLNKDKDMHICKFDISDNLNEDDLFELIDLSYESVLSTLPEEERDEILDLEW